MEQSFSWEANKSSASREIPRIFWNPNVHYCIHNSPPPVINPVPMLLCMIRDVFTFLRQGVVRPRPNSMLEAHPVSAVCDVRSYPSYLQAVSPSATWGRCVPWWQGPTYHCDRDPLTTVTGTHLSRAVFIQKLKFRIDFQNAAICCHIPYFTYEKSSEIKYVSAEWKHLKFRISVRWFWK